MTSPTYGLLVPCKNGASFLQRLFDSAHAQTKPFDEIWLFDDGSTDNSAELASRLGAQVLRSDKSLGPSAARNRLIEACQCDWLHFHDADDTMDPHYLERVSTAAIAGTDVVVCNMQWLEEQTGRIENHWCYDTAEFARDAQSYLIVNTVGGINGLYRRTTLEAIKGFDESLHFWEDTDLNLRLARHGAHIVAVPEDLVSAYRRTSSYSNTNLNAVWRAKLALMTALLPQAHHSLRATIAIEAERVAGRLAQLNAWRDVPSALDLAVRAGGNPPTTDNLALRTLKHLLPRTWTFRLQHRLRHRSAS